ncbi:hypothetical protein SRHO_G00118950 [Serrasalmus rhombeus]
MNTLKLDSPSNRDPAEAGHPLWAQLSGSSSHLSEITLSMGRVGERVKKAVWRRKHFHFRHFLEWSYYSAFEELSFTDISEKQQGLNLVNCFVSC